MTGELIPVKKPHNNKVYKGYDPKNLVGVEKIEDLNLTDDGEAFNSVWRCNNIWERIKFLFFGELTLRVIGRAQPAVSIILGDVYEDKLFCTTTLSVDEQPAFTLCPGHVDVKTFNKAKKNEGWIGDPVQESELKREWWVKNGTNFALAREGQPGARPYTVMNWG